MLAVHPAGTEPDTQKADPQAVAERGLRSSCYAALKHVPCNYQGGVLVHAAASPPTTS
jgi:hypothetical protein